MSTSQHPEYFPIPASMSGAKITPAKYDAMYKQSVEDPEGFWREHGKRIDWMKPYTQVKDVDFADNARIRWFYDGTLNACYNCVDRHLPARANQTALLREGDQAGDSSAITYAQLKDEVCKLANALKSRGVKKGDRVTVYMPMVPEAVYAMLACARIGAVHSVVFGGFSPTSLRDRILDCDSTVVITADEGLRGGKKVPLKANTDAALAECPDVATVIVLKRTGGGSPADNNGGDVPMKNGRDIWYHDICGVQSTECPCEEMNAEDPLFILYTSGSTGKPKGVLHTTGGYMVYAAMTHEYVFDYKDGDVYWCTADVGWVTGHSYIVYGPLANGATSLVFEGVPTYPDYGRFWETIARHKVNIFYTAPTAIRALLREGDSWVKKYDRSSLRILGSVGEPINEEAWMWYYETVGDKRCPVVDTWWQTETGGILITPLPGAHELKPSYASRPFFGVTPALVDAEGKFLEGEAEGNLVLTDSWPGQMRTVYKDHARFVQTYFSAYKGMYFTGDGCRRDARGYYRITGRVDDVINVSGHRIGTAELEDALNSHDMIAESAVVGYPHDLKGQGIYAYVILMEGASADDALRKDIVAHVRKVIGPIATPDVVLFAPGLPKTRSGKIMRRILRKVAEDAFDQLGDISTLADPSIVDTIISNHKSLTQKAA
ncbi:MAG: acetate--CoA ligase [Alphaproteobacteria bacterium]|nr:acetate--CoA ligase [Alphaproteobacteria bacterium]